uniref:protein FAR-RED IMPAIRED RESPONSE 1-like n=1 Tax=Erigeron canadensis TaxID=72917 RepID=UPI001CB987FE|nr:protein FAR-RED IMPAIRED RESPONSE 1-like [Erigeron canadensis]
MVVTDQDPAMKKAIEAVLLESRHTLCMWHITQKLPSKVGNDMFEHSDFKKKFNDIVWNLSIDTNTFEKKWFEIIKEFDLEDHEWFTHMYSIRSTWIPAYFRDLYMSGLMRTTSRSESENSFFSNFTTEKSTLVHFMLSYESAMEKQESRLEFLDHQSLIKTTRFSTRLNIEKQACDVYTRAIFLLVQNEIQISIYDCAQISVNSEEGVDKKRGRRKGKKKGVEEDEEEVEDLRTVEGEEIEDTNRALFSKDQENSASTSNNERVKKTFIFKANGIEQIPEKYIIRRWRKDLILPGMRTRRTRYGESNEEFERLTNEAHYIVENCMTLFGNDEAMLSAFVDKVRSLKERKIENPEVEGFKGCGRRLKSSKEIAMEQSMKHKRKYASCGRMTFHDKRNCAKKTKEEEEKRAKAEALKASKKKKYYQRNKFKSHEYEKVPEIVFWDLRDSPSTPVIANQKEVS